MATVAVVVPVDVAVDQTTCTCFANTLSISARVTSGSFAIQGRRHYMEDRVFRCDDSRFYAVFDGHGGDDVADYVVKNASCVFSVLAESEPVRVALTSTFLALDRHLLQRHAIIRTQAGSTGLIALVHGTTLWVANAGDSECVAGVRDREEEGHVTAPLLLSTKHWPDTLAEQERIQNAGGTVHNKRLGGVYAVSRSFGDFAFKRPTTRHDIMTALPDITEMHLDSRMSFIVLASDGVFERLSYHDVVQHVNTLKEEGRSARAAAHSVVDLAYTAGSFDNIAAVVVYFDW